MQETVRQHYVPRTYLKRDYAATKASGQNNFMFGNTKISIEGKTLEDIKREHREETKPVLILSQLRHAMKLISNRVTSDSIVISTLADQEAFITSDNPVTCNNIEEGPIMPIDPSNILSLPLDARTHLALMPADDPSRLQSIYRTTYAGNLGKFSVLALNYGQEKNADRFLLGKAYALTTYMQDKVRMESEEPDEQTKKFRSMVSDIDSMFESFKQNQ